jgi:hypothetical protein
MRARLLELVARKAALTERACAERERLAALLGEARGAFALAAGGALLLVLRPRRVLKWVARGWSTLQIYRAARLWWSSAR